MEGDNTSSTELIHKMIVRMNEGFDVILASPHIYGGGFTETSILRVCLSNLSTLFVSYFLGLKGIFTVSSFFRLYNANIICKIQKEYNSNIIESVGFECMVELLMKMVNINKHSI